MASPLDIINETLDLVSGQLRDLGVEVSPFTSQVIMLVLIAVILTAMRKKFQPLSNLDGKGAAMLAAPVLIGLVILASWADQFFNPPPKFVIAGVIHAENLDGLVLDLLGPDGHAMQRGGPVIEQSSGEFFARYDYGVTRYPRQIRISQMGCSTTLTPVNLAQLRAGHDFQIIHSCGSDV
jgi:hypothetical protein